jgi:hypothetical protein
MILGALADAGGREYLRRQAAQNPVAFMTLLGKVLPLQVQSSGGGVNLLEQLAQAAMEIKARREAAALPTPARPGPVIEAEPITPPEPAKFD